MFKKTTDVKRSSTFPPVLDEILPTTSVTEGQGVVKDIGRNAITSRADVIRHTTDESMIWQTTPSLTLLVMPVVLSIILFVAALAASHLAVDRLSSLRAEALATSSAAGRSAGRNAKTSVRRTAQQAAMFSDEEFTALSTWITRAPFILAALLVLGLLLRMLVLKTTKYSATSQRLLVERGVLLTRNVPYELHRLGSALILRPLYLRPFGVAHLAIGGMNRPLIGLRNPDYVRDILRTGGQLEAQRVEKIRWR